MWNFKLQNLYQMHRANDDDIPNNNNSNNYHNNYDNTKTKQANKEL